MDKGQARRRLIVRTRPACRSWPNAPFPATSHAQGTERRQKQATPKARVRSAREHGGKMRHQDLSRGSQIYFPVYVQGAGLSDGHLPLQPGRRRNTFCGASHGRLDNGLRRLIPRRLAKYGIQEPDLQTQPDHAELQTTTDLRSISSMSEGKRTYMDVNVAYRQAACKTAIEYMTKFRHSRAQAHRSWERTCRGT